MPDEVRLVLGSQEFGGWTGMSVTRSIEAGAGSFALDLSDRWPGQPKRQPILCGDPCRIKIGEDVLITGWVDEVGVQLDATSHGISVRGRDAVGDLIDCAPDVDASPNRDPDAMPAEWTNIGLLDLVTAIAAPFGIPVRSEVAYLGQAFQQFALNPGQRAFEAIETACRYRQVLPVSDGLGGLVLMQAGRERVHAPIVEGRNLLSGSVTYSNQDRFRTILVKGQASDDGFFGSGAGTFAGAALDTRIRRHRPLYLQADQEVTDETCEQRAAWEALTRAARGSQGVVAVQGWRIREGGALWPLNALIPVESPTLGLTGEFLVSQVTYSLTEDGGTVTSLAVVRPDAFRPPPSQEIRAERHGFGDLRMLERQARRFGFGDLKKLEG